MDLWLDAVSPGAVFFGETALFELRSVRPIVVDLNGAVAVEFAFALPILLSVLVIATDLSLGIYAREQVQNAARAGAEFAATRGYYLDGIKNAAVNSVSSRKIVQITTSNVFPSEYCGCSVGGAIIDVSQTGTGTNPYPSCAGPVCSTGYSPVLYASVTVQNVNYNAILPNFWGGLATQKPLSATFVARTF